jgi:hypothetical protein
MLMMTAMGWGQEQKPADLFRTVKGLDTALFDAYNRCDMPKLMALVDDGLEFYHDQSGLEVGAALFRSSIEKYICGKVRRELVESSLEVYPLKGFGAVEIGVHRFTHPGIDNEVGEAKFVMVWRNEGGKWKLTRVISFDHAAVKK